MLASDLPRFNHKLAIFGVRTVNRFMRFRQYFLLTEEDPAAGAPPMAAPSGLTPPAGAPPMGAPPPGMGGDPMGGGMGAPPGAAGPAESPVIPQNANVWDVLDSILNHKPLKHDEDLKKQQQQKAQNPSPAGQSPMGGPPMGGPPPMGGGGGPLMM
jgi:basic salivary proline-rich protein 1/2